VLFRSRHAVPLVAQPAAEQAQGEACRSRFGHRPVGGRVEARAAVAGGEYAVFVAARLAARGAGRERPLLRTVALQYAVVEAADVEIAADRERAVLAEQCRWRGRFEQRRRAGYGEPRLQPERDL